MKKNKYFQKNSTPKDAWKKILSEYVTEVIPDSTKSQISTTVNQLKNKLPSYNELQTIAKDKLVDRFKSSITDPIESKIKQERYNRETSSLSSAYKKTKNITDSIFNAATVYVANDPNLKQSISTAAKINSNAAKTFVRLSNVKLPSNISAKQINDIFDSDGVIGLMATSKTTEELSHKIKAGLVLDKIGKTIYGNVKNNRKQMM